MFRFESLDIWKYSREFCNKIYLITEKFPNHEIFGLTSQIRRAAVSITANIAEGSASFSKKEFRNYLSIAIKSNVEVVSETCIAKDRQYISEEMYKNIYKEAEILVKRITSFRNSL